MYFQCLKSREESESIEGVNRREVEGTMITKENVRIFLVRLAECIGKSMGRYEGKNC